jgi:hypothetical protein
MFKNTPLPLDQHGKQIPSTIGTLILFLVLLILAPAVKAQAISNIEAIHVGSDTYKRLASDPSHAFRCTDEAASKWLIIVAFDREIADTSQAEDARNYTLVDLGTVASITPLEAKMFSTVDKASVGLCVDTDLTTPKDSLLLNQYQVKVRNIAFVGVEDKPNEAKSLLVASVEFRDSNDLPSASATPSGIKLEAVDSPEESDIYFNGELRRASGTPFFGAVDANIAYPVYRGDLDTVKPFFELKASGDPEEDPDTMKFGVKWDRTLKDFDSRVFLTLAMTNEGVVEAERDFDTTNIRWGGRLTLFSKRSPKWPWFDPFVGVELGRNVRSPLPAAEDRGLARIVFGSRLTKRWGFGLKSLDSLNFEATYERRVLLLREISFEEKEKELVLVDFGKRPRDWVEGKFTLNFKPYWGFYIGYEYGELPPAFKLVDHRMKMGLLFRAKIK